MANAHAGARPIAGTMEVTVRLLDPIPPSDDRKALARQARAAIAAALSSVAARPAYRRARND